MQNYYNGGINKSKRFNRIDPSMINSGQTKASSRNHLESPFKVKRDSVNTIFHESKHGDSTPANVRYS